MLENYFCQWGVFKCAFLEACLQFVVIGKKLNVNNSKKKSNIAQMRTQNNFVWKIINVKIKHKRNANKRKNIFLKKNTRRKLVKTKRTKNIKQKHNQWHKN
jgi:hypothetical protein